MTGALWDEAPPEFGDDVEIVIEHLAAADPTWLARLRVELSRAESPLVEVTFDLTESALWRLYTALADVIDRHEAERAAGVRA